MNKITRKIAKIIDENTSDCYPTYGETDCEKAANAVLKCIIEEIQVLTDHFFIETQKYAMKTPEHTVNNTAAVAITKIIHLLRD